MVDISYPLVELSLYCIESMLMTAQPGGGHSLLTGRGLSAYCLEPRLMTAQPGGGHSILTGKVVSAYCLESRVDNSATWLRTFVTHR